MRFTTIIARNLLRRRTRTLLTLVGLGVGIAAVTALVGIAWGFERSFLSLYESKGIDLVVMRAGVTDRLTSNLDAALAGRLRAIPGVREVAGSLVDAVSFDEANLVGVLVNGWEPDSLLFRGIRIVSGRRWRPDEPRGALLGRVLALNLGKKVGDRFDVSGQTFQVVGIFESPSAFENGAMIVPIDELRTMMGREGQVTGFVVAAARGADRAAIDDLTRRIERTIPHVAAVPARDYIGQDIQVRLVRAMAWGTSALALVLGSLGMLNTMVMSVFERTREIGVLRALGWRRWRVLRLVLGEAVLLGLGGSALGLPLGYLGIRALALAPTASSFVSSEMPLALVPVALVMGVGLSLLGGLYPAFRGASLDPIEALRHE